MAPGTYRLAQEWLLQPTAVPINLWVVMFNHHHCALGGTGKTKLSQEALLGTCAEGKWLSAAHWEADKEF